MRKPRWDSLVLIRRALALSLCRISFLCRFRRLKFAMLLTWWWRWWILVLLFLMRLMQGICLIPVGAELWKRLRMISSFTVSFVSCAAAHNSKQFFVQADMWVHLCKLWFKMQVFVYFCKLCNFKKVTTWSPTWDLITGSWLSSLSWAVFMLFSASPSGHLFLLRSRCNFTPLMLIE